MILTPLFIYGTLAPNESNHHVLDPIKDPVWLPAHTYGIVLPNGFGRASGYPALIPTDKDTPNAQLVKGWLFGSDELIDHWAYLDEFEGKGYVRAMIEVYVGHHFIPAFVYRLAHQETKEYLQGLSQ